jgi:single-strand DNA-binding protein
MKSMPSGQSMAKLSVATSESWTDKNTGQKQEKTEWHHVSAFDKLATIVERYMKKGLLVYVEGQLTTRSWDDKDSGQKRYMTEIRAKDIQMLSGRKEGAGGSETGGGGPAGPDPVHADDDDVPF